MARLIFDPEGDVLLTIPDPASNTVAVGEVQVKEEENSEGSRTEMLVSSKHLALASPVFKAMLRPHFSEGLALQSSGCVTIPLFDDDPHALEVAMNIIHWQLPKMPEQMSLIELVHIAVLVDKYRLHDSIGHFAQNWIQNLDMAPATPANMVPSLHLMICVTWVFNVRDLFRKMTLLAIKFFTGSSSYQVEINGYPAELPIPQAVMEKIESERLCSIKSALLILQDSIEKYKNNSVVHCPRSSSRLKASEANTMLAVLCDSATYGALIKCALAKQLYPAPTPPYNELSYLGAVSRIRNIAELIPSHCQELDKAKAAKVVGEPPTSCHDLKESIPSALQNLTASIQGLDLRNFLPTLEPRPAQKRSADEISIMGFPSTL